MMQLNVGEQWYSFNKDKYILEKLPLILLSFQDFRPSSLRWQIKYIFLCCSVCDASKNILEIHLSYDHPRFLWRHGPEKSCAYTDTTTHMSSSQEFKVTANLCWQIKRPMLAIVTYYGASLINQWECCSISWLNCSNHVHTNVYKSTNVRQASVIHNMLCRYSILYDSSSIIQHYCILINCACFVLFVCSNL